MGVHSRCTVLWAAHAARPGDIRSPDTQNPSARDGRGVLLFRISQAELSANAREMQALKLYAVTNVILIIMIKMSIPSLGLSNRLLPYLVVVWHFRDLDRRGRFETAAR
jgi:hypothetical protein